MTLSRRTALFGLFCFALIVIARVPLGRLLTLTLDGNHDNASYVLLVPPVTAALILRRREGIFADPRTSPGPAIILLVLSGIVYSALQLWGMGLDEIDQLGVTTLCGVLCLLSGFLFFYGVNAFKAGLFPLLFLFLAVPIPLSAFHEVAVFLQRGSADAVAILFRLSGTPAYRNSEFVFVLPSVTIEVAEACSGIRSSIGMFIVTLLAGHLLLRSNWKRAGLVILVIPISLLKNAVRIVTLTLLAVHYDMGFLTGSLHHDGGILFMVFGLGMMYPVLSLLIRLDGKRHLAGGVQLL